MDSKLMAIASEHGRLYFNPVLDMDEELAHGVYRVLVQLGKKDWIDEIEVDEIVSDDEMDDS